ncbi:MAG: MBL fold metallo-hydrolase [Syntrophales bacterium]|nr:MBL fold metallo-hydrolase [Syntrophales bacterium]
MPKIFHDPKDDLVIGKLTASFFGLKLDVYIYYVEGTLIDTGPSNLSRDIKKFLTTFRPNQVIITHLHEDHCGLGYWINDVYPEVPIYVSPLRIEETEIESPLPLYRRLFWGRRLPFKALAHPEFLETKSHRLHVIHVGGHSYDHVVIHEPCRGWLFVGDLFLTTKPISIFHEENAADMIKALEKILSLDFTHLFCSHRGPYTKGRELIQKKKEYLEDLQVKVQDLKRKGFTIEEIDRILFPQKTLATYISRGEWSSLNVIKTL